MQVIIDQQDYNDLLKYKEAVETNMYIVRRNSWGMGGNIEMAYCESREAVFGLMDKENDRLREEVDELKARKWWQLIFKS